MARAQGPLIRPDTDPGRSIVILPDPVTVTSPASLLVVPAPPGSPVGKGTILDIDGSDEESTVTTVTLVNTNLRYPGPSFPPGLAGQARASALIEWGVGGTQAQAFVDFQHGFSFSVPASFLRITGINEPLPTLDPFGLFPILGRSVQLGAFCSYGSVSRGGQLTGKKTEFINTAIAPAGTLDIPIPPFATNFTFYRNPDPGAAFVSVLDDMGIGIMSVDYTVGVPNSETNVIELPNAAASLFIANTGAAPLAGIVVFGISI